MIYVTRLVDAYGQSFENHTLDNRLFRSNRTLGGNYRTRYTNIHRLKNFTTMRETLEDVRDFRKTS